MKRKNTRNFIICVIISALVLAGLDLALYPCTFMRNDIHAVSTAQHDVLLLGTSASKMNIDPDILLDGTDMSGHNLCVGGEYPVDAYYILKLVLEKQNPKTIIYDVDPAYFTMEKTPGNNYMLFYHEFPLSATKAEYFFDTMKDNDFRSMLFPFYEYPIQTLIPRVKNNLYQKITGNYDISYLKGKQQEYHENGFIEEYPVAPEAFPAFTEFNFSTENVKLQNMEYMDKIIDLCRERDIEFIAVTNPLPDPVLAECADSCNEAWDYFEGYFAEKNVTYYNFNRGHYDAFSHDLEHYVDYSGHMVGESARQFSKVFGGILKDDSAL